MNSGASAINPLNSFPKKNVINQGSGGGNSGAVLSPTPKLGLSAYQDPKIKVTRKLPKFQGGS